MFLKSAEFLVRAIKFPKWLIYDLSALKLAQPNPWLENITFFEQALKSMPISAEFARSKSFID